MLGFPYEINNNMLLSPSMYHEQYRGAPHYSIDERELRIAEWTQDYWKIEDVTNVAE